ncbi:MAG: flagellar hook-associated protein FlgK, partial [Lachnospiraceae bacterium]|nr:flagellar hook-associated protein FlgK [Lachnospiraceae bacterium]
MGIFGSLYVGASGLQTSQNALNTVAHNMTNVDTEGFTRQQVRQSTRFYNTISKSASANAYQQIGLGVQFAEVAQVRDYFLDKSYRREHGREGFYNVSCDAIEEVEEIFQELDGEAFADTLKNIWEAVEEIAKDPSNTVNQGILVQRCNEFVNRSKLVYQDLSNYQDDLNYDVKQKVDRINEIGKRIDEV